MKNANVELPPIHPPRVDFDGFGASLHAELLEDMRKNNFDSFAARNDTSTDAAFLNSQRLVQADNALRQRLTGPSIQREKFSSSYWRNWNKEKDLLEDISYDVVIKKNMSSYLSSTTRKSMVQNRTMDAKSITMALKTKRKKPQRAKQIKAVAFDAPGAYEMRSKYVDRSSNQGDTSVTFLMKSCLQQQIPRNPRELHATVDPDDIGTKPLKGGGMSTADRTSRNFGVTVTSKCDFPPMETPIQANKGITFSPNPRFKSPPPPLIKADDETLSTIERPARTPGVLFDRASRFGQDKASQPSVMLRIPVKVDASMVSSVTVGDASAEEDEGDDGEEAEENGAGSIRPSSSIRSDTGDSAADDRDLERSQDDGTAEHEGSAVQQNSLSLTASQASTQQHQGEEQQYVEYEYFPGDAPGPGQYEIPRLFDDKKSNRAEEFEALIAKYRAVKPGLAGLKCEDLTNVGVFGQECNRNEHILYGMCLDGRCCRRSEVEKYILRRNDLRRFAGYAAVEKHGRNKEGLTEEIIYSQALRDALPTAEYAVEPLYAAAYNGDIPAIQSLAKLKINPNGKHPQSGYTALHVAVFRCKLDAVAALLAYFRGPLQIDIQDKKGDTPLHIASRMGFVEIASLICDEDACDPLVCTNENGKYPIDVVRSHKVFQVIKVCQTRNELREELQALKKHK